MTTTRSLSPDEFKQLAQDHLDGLASDDDVAILRSHEDEWVDGLRRLLQDVEETLRRVRDTVSGPERDLVLDDFEQERVRIVEAISELTGEAPDGDDDEDSSDETDDDSQDEDDEPDEPDESDEQVTGPALQLSWSDAQIVAWSAGHGSSPEGAEQLAARLEAAGAPKVWEEHEPLSLPGGQKAHAVKAPVGSTLGWLVAVGISDHDPEVGPSATWMGRVAALAVRLAAQGRMVPQLEELGSGNGKGGGKGRSVFAVRWQPALVDNDELQVLVRSMPGAVAVDEQQRDPQAVTRAILAGFLDEICRDAARRVEVPAPPPSPRSGAEVAETVLARLDGTSFDAPQQLGHELHRALQRWARPVTSTQDLRLVIQLDPPDSGDAWHLRTLAPRGKGKPEMVEAAMSNASHSRRERIKTELERLEGLYPPLMRGRSKRRGEVILDQGQAWDLMTRMGPILQAAGFEVRVPPLSLKKPKAGLKLTSISTADSKVGAQQLADVRWSAVFGDVELDADDIRRLSAESRPLIRTQGRWVELDHADLDAAAAALQERAKQKQMSGADMLRHALGLEGAPLGSEISVAGHGWAADLIRSAREVPEEPTTKPDGFEGELRGYQANALAWIEFLDSAGLGGCLALDMGLGKTPTVLAHLRNSTKRGPALVIAPPAVVGNWASEARRFVPDLNVVVHHGASRADEEDIAGEVADADVLLTTYGTAVRDIEALSEMQWGNVVLDEAQVIKNPTNETSQQLRRLQAHTRLALTGTPIENGLGDLWALLDFTNPGLVGDRASFVAQLSKAGEGRAGAESALRTLNGVLVFRRTKAEPAIAEELPDRIDELDHCPMTPEQIGLYQAVLDELVVKSESDGDKKKGAVLAAITALKQICNHPAAYTGDDGPLEGRSGKLARLDEIVDNVFEAGERVLIFTHFATWGERLAKHLTKRTGIDIGCYHGGLARGARDRMVKDFQEGEGPGALVLSLKAGGTGLNLTAASHVVLYDRWWNPAVEDQARDRAWRIGQTRTVVAHRLVCPGTVDERVEEVVAGKRRIADMVLPKSSSVGDLDSDQLRTALGIKPEALLTDEDAAPTGEEAA